MAFYLKDPRSTVDYAIDWSPYLDGQVVSESAWTVTPQEDGGVAVEDAEYDDARTMARLVGGHHGSTYAVANTVKLSDGTSDTRSITLRIEER